MSCCLTAMLTGTSLCMQPLHLSLCALSIYCISVCLGDDSKRLLVWNTTWWQWCQVRSTCTCSSNQIAMANPGPLFPLERFDFAHPNTWPRWIKLFKQYWVASRLADKDNPLQISTLIYAMGEKAEDILASFGLDERDGENYSFVQEQFTHQAVW